MALDYISDTITREEFYEKIHSKSGSDSAVETAKAHITNLDYFSKDKYCKETELIHYVDFNDYSKIIKKRDNWRDVFKDYFINDEMISSKLLELEPIRNSIGHSRELTSEEKQILELYTRQILRCII